MKKIISIVLAMAMLMSTFTLTAFAADGNVTGHDAMKVTTTGTYDVVYGEFTALATYPEFNDCADYNTFMTVNVFDEGTTFNIANVGTDKTAYINFWHYQYSLRTQDEYRALEFYDDDYNLIEEYDNFNLKGHYVTDWERMVLMDVNNGVPTWELDPWDDMDPGVKVYAGESVALTLPNLGAGNFYVLYVSIYYPEDDYSYWYRYLITHDDTIGQKTLEGTADSYMESYKDETLLSTTQKKDTEAPATPVSFEDVKQGDWYYNAVYWAIENKITNGTSGTTFSPNDTCTVAQILTFLWRAYGSQKPVNDSAFYNLTGNEYYFDAANWAYERGLVKIGEFKADTPCTRMMVVEYLWKLAGKPNTDVDNKFTDVDFENPASKAVLWAVENGITNGTGDTTFSPDMTCTRAQIVTFLHRALIK